MTAGRHRCVSICSGAYFCSTASGVTSQFGVGRPASSTNWARSAMGQREGLAQPPNGAGAHERFGGTDRRRYVWVKSIRSPTSARASPCEPGRAPSRRRHAPRKRVVHLANDALRALRQPELVEPATVEAAAQPRISGELPGADRVQQPGHGVSKAARPNPKVVVVDECDHASVRLFVHRIAGPSLGQRRPPAAIRCAPTPSRSAPRSPDRPRRRRTRASRGTRRRWRR